MKNSQILVTTHSPYFVSGAEFESVRLIRKEVQPDRAAVYSTTHEKLTEFLKENSFIKETAKPAGIRAKINQSLQPYLNEMFFCRFPVFVEGLEDVAFITTALHLYGYWDRFHSLGCHLIPANGKGHLIHPAALGRLMSMPYFLIFDCDANITKVEHRDRHVPDNRTLFKIAGLPSDEAFPDDIVRSPKCWAWKTNFGNTVEADFDGELLAKYKEQAQNTCGHASSLEKNSMYIAEWLTNAYDDGNSSTMLQELCAAIIEAASVGLMPKGPVLIPAEVVIVEVATPDASSIDAALASSIPKTAVATEGSAVKTSSEPAS